MTEADKKLGERLRTLYRDNVSTYGNVHPEFWAILAAEARRLVAAELAGRVVDDVEIRNILRQARCDSLEKGNHDPWSDAAWDEVMQAIRPTLATLAAKLEAAEIENNRLREFIANPPRHKFWGAGEKDCPREIKAGNGELHTLKCKACGAENPRNDTMTPPNGVIDHQTWNQALDFAASCLEESNQSIRLHAGELKMDEMRAVQAVLKWKKAQLLCHKFKD